MKKAPIFLTLLLSIPLHAEIVTDIRNYDTVYSWDGYYDEQWDVVFINTGPRAETIEIWAHVSDGGSRSHAGYVADEHWGTITLQPGEESAAYRGFRNATRPHNAAGERPYNEPFWLSAPTPPNRSPTIAWGSAPVSAANGQSYFVSAQANDQDGNLTAVSVWKDEQPFAFAGGGNGTDGDSGNWTSDAGPRKITFTAQAVDADGLASPVISHTVTIDAPVNHPPTVTLLSPGAQTITAGTTLTISSRAIDPDGNLTNHNLDIQRPDGAWNFDGGFATGGPYQGGPVGSGGDSTRSASFCFSDIGTYYVRSAASDSSGWYHSATVAITVVAPPPVQYTLVTVAGAGGTVTPGGTFTAGALATVTATPDAAHNFAGWSGDVNSATNPLGVLMDRNRTVQALFMPKVFSLVTSASGGGSVTPGGNYPYGSTATVVAVSDATHRFAGWTGDASGLSPTIMLTITRALAVHAAFEEKTAQTILFTALGDQNVGASFPLNITSTSGLPVTITVSGPASFANGILTLVGAGSVSIQATQGGNDYYLPAAPVTRTFNAAAPGVLKYVMPPRTLLQTGRVPESPAYTIQPNP